MNQISERFGQIYSVLQEILIKHQDQLQTVNDEQENLQQKINEKEKEIELWFSKTADMCLINLSNIELNLFS